jgi:Ca2+-binding RTX toxin-like protein
VTQNGTDTLTGGTGADFFNLDTGNTTLVGDVANGGGGNDSFVIRQSTVGGSVVNLDGGTGSDTLRVIAGANLDLSSLNAKNFEKIDLRGDGASTQVSLSKTDILALVDNGTKVLTLRLDSADSYVIEPETGITVTQGQSASFYNGAIAPANLIAQVNFEYA